MGGQCVGRRCAIRAGARALRGAWHTARTEAELTATWDLCKFKRHEFKQQLALLLALAEL
eukprot:6578020-Prymnesium_polylepis.1